MFYDFTSLEDFLDDYVTFGNIEKFLKYMLNDMLCITHKNDLDNTSMMYEKRINDISSTFNSVFDESFKTVIQRISASTTYYIRAFKIPCHINSDRRNPITPKLKF